MNMNCDNAAFTEPNQASSEIARILRELASKLEDVSLAEVHDSLTLQLRDINGNKVGQFKVAL